MRVLRVHVCTAGLKEDDLASLFARIDLLQKAEDISEATGLDVKAAIAKAEQAQGTVSQSLLLLLYAWSDKKSGSDHRHNGSSVTTVSAATSSTPAAYPACLRAQNEVPTSSYSSSTPYSSIWLEAWLPVSQATNSFPPSTTKSSNCT